jgi:hypothetical protein
LSGAVWGPACQPLTVGRDRVAGAGRTRATSAAHWQLLHNPHLEHEVAGADAKLREGVLTRRRVEHLAVRGGGLRNGGQPHTTVNALRAPA